MKISSQSEMALEFQQKMQKKNKNTMVSSINLAL